MTPQVPINDKSFYPIYAKCIELDIPICITTGVPGPRVPMALPEDRAARRGVLVLPRAEGRDAPRRRAVGRAGREAHAQVAEPLLLDLARSRRSYYPQTIIDYANTRGADKVMYAGYFPMGLSLERIFSELPERAASRTTCGRSSCARTPSGCSGWTADDDRTLDRSPFPVPFGWFCVGYPEDFPTGEPKALYYFDRHLVAWRDETGELHVQDAFCPHLGAHLGHGGTVDGCEIVCPFHGWKFDAEGAQHRHPLLASAPTGRARCAPSRSSSATACRCVWYHPDATVEPHVGDPASCPSSTATPSGPPSSAPRYRSTPPWQEMAENGVDSAHFRYVHNTAEVPEMESYETGFPGTQMRSSQKFPTPRGVMEGRIDSEPSGPGIVARALQRASSTR